MAAPRKGRDAAGKPIRNAPRKGSWRETATGWRFRAVIGETAAGKAIHHDFYGRTKEEAIAKSEEYKAANPNGPPSTDARQSLKTLCTTWLTLEVEPHNEVSTLESYADTFKNHIFPRIGDVPLCEIAKTSLQKWVNEMHAEGVGGRTIEYAHGIVRAALNYAVECEIIEKNPALKIKLPEYKARKAVALTLAQVRALLEAAAGRLDVRKPRRRKNGLMVRPIRVSGRLFVLYLLYIILGTRRGELLALRWSDIDFKTGAIRIQRSIDKRGRERGTKTDDSDRTVYLDEPGLAALEGHRRAMRAEGQTEADDPEGLVFVSEKGTPIMPDNVGRHFKLILAAAGLPLTIRIHDLRHTAASLMLARGNQAINVSKLLGHSNQTITDIVYSHAYEEGKRLAIASVSQLLIEGGD